jgi:small subunit ribosomal protein S10e
MKLLQSLGSKKWCTVTFNWRFYYYILTDLGIQELRKFLGIGEDIHPLTLTKTVEDTNTLIKREPRADRPPREGGFRPREGGFRPREGGRGEGGFRPREGGDRPRFSGRGRGDGESYRKRE